jgi:hypothetical protein
MVYAMKAILRSRSQIGRFLGHIQSGFLPTVRRRSFSLLPHRHDNAAINTRTSLLIPTLCDSRHSIPLTVSDIHLRHEQLPFSYFFRETLDEATLLSSFRSVLRHFPILGGRLACSRLVIRCDPDDSVPFTVGDIDISLDDWLARKSNQNHSHKSASGYPTLLPLFDALFQNNHHGDVDEDPGGGKQQHSYKYENLVKIRVTYFKGGGTAIGVNMNHVMGDTASCVRFVRCWGREMRQQAYPLGACNVRANATCSGMMTSDLADLMGLNKGPILPSFWANLYKKYVSSEAVTTRSDENAPSLSAPVLNHEYTDLSFPPLVLNAMKSCGMAECGLATYISTNDMITAFGWLLKRSLSGEDAYNISMVVNVRGRCGVDAFADMDNLVNERSGLFGNGITNVVAAHPPTTGLIGILDVATAAIAIRAALLAGLLEVPYRIAESKRGAPTAAMNSSSTFSTTSWGEFQVFKIRFSEEELFGFHGHPSFPLPTGRTFSSVISPASTGGYTYKLLLPSDKVREAKKIHERLCTLFLSWQSTSRAAAKLGGPVEKVSLMPITKPVVPLPAMF